MEINFKYHGHFMKKWLNLQFLNNQKKSKINIINAEKHPTFKL